RPPRLTPFPYTTLFRSATPRTLTDPAALVPVEEAVIRDGFPAAWLGAGSGPDSQEERDRQPGSHCAMLVPLIAGGRKLGALTVRSEEHTSELQSPYDLV